MLPKFFFKFQSALNLNLVSLDPKHQVIATRRTTPKFGLVLWSGSLFATVVF